MSAEPSLVVLIPALNEEQSVGGVVSRVRALGYPVCVIDDGSQDATAAVARAAGAEVLRLPLNLGVGGAIRCGFRYALEAGYDMAAQVDADGQHDPGEIPRLLAIMRERDADLVVGSRFAGGGEYPVTRSRRFAMRVLARRASRAAHSPITDSTSGFRLVRRPLLDAFARDYPVEYLGDTVEALISAGNRGARIVECPVSMSVRAEGASSAGPLGSIWYLVRVLVAVDVLHRHRRRRPPPAMPRDGAVP